MKETRLPSIREPSSHFFLPTNERIWRQRYCIPRNCRHSNRATWLCVERFLSTVPGSTQLESTTLPPGGRRFEEFKRLMGRPEMHPEEAASLIDEAYRRTIGKIGAKLLRQSKRLG